MDMFIQTNNMNWQPSTVNAQQEEGVKYILRPSSATTSMV